MSWLTRISLRNRSVVALAVLAVVLFGALAVVRLRQELIPNIEYPALTVFTTQIGASPADVERGITTPLESGLKGLTGLKELDSYSNEGASIIVALFEYGTDMEKAQAAAGQAVQRSSAMLPTGSQPTVRAINFGDLPVVQLAVSSPLPPAQLAALLQQKVVPQLQQIGGVADVSLSGVQGAQLAVELQPLALVKYGVSPQAVLATLRAANVSLPVGTVAGDGKVLPVRVSSRAVDLAALNALPVQVSGPVGTAASPVSASRSEGAPVRLDQVARLSIAATPATSITRTNGRPSVGIAITKTADGNVVQISQEVQKSLPGVQRELGAGAVVTTVVDQAPNITQSISSMWREGLVGAIFAILVILLFLRSWRSTIVAGISIPLSVVVALLVLWSRGESLNMLTLAGLTIAIGRVIDDSIVVLENAYRHLQEGDDVRTAAQSATREVASAVTASTLTTVAVFLPLGFVHGIASEFFRPFALTVTFALTASLIVSLTVVPVAVTWLLSKGHVGHREADEMNLLQRLYVPTLRWAVSHRAITLVVATLVFVGSMALAPLLKTNLLDSSHDPSLSVTQELPPGTAASATAQAAAQVEAVLAKTTGVRVYQVVIGSTGGLMGPGGGTDASSARAAFSVTVDEKADKDAVVADLRGKLAALGTSAGQVTVDPGGNAMGGNSSEIQVRLYADDPQVLQQANKVVFDRLSRLPDLTNVSSNLSAELPQIAVKVDPVKAGAAGLDANGVGQFVSMVLHGLPAGTIPVDHAVLPAVITLPLMTGGDVNRLGAMPVAGTSGVVPLGRIAQVSVVKEPVQVTHIGGERTVTVSGTSAGGNVGATSTTVQRELQAISMPTGSRWEMAGATQQMNEMFSSLAVAMLVAILLVYVIMVGTFRSLLSPLILLVSIPFAAVGAVVMLLLAGVSLGMPSLIGLLMLIGIVVTNAIVLLDLVEQFRARGMDARTAVIEGARRRLRPILMTAVATILALAPMALGLGGGSFLSKPLAVVVIGGLVSSTALTLVIVPVVYLSVESLRRGRPSEVE